MSFTLENGVCTASHHLLCARYKGVGRGDEDDERSAATLASAVLPMPDSLPFHRYDIPAENLDKLKKQLQKLSKKCSRLGFAPLIAHVVGRGTRADQGAVYAYVTVELCGQPLKLEGWSFLGTLEHVEDEVLLRSIPGKQIPESYKQARPEWCDQCKLVRARTKSFVISHDDGTTMQVGRNCLVDFFAGHDPHALASYAELLQSAQDLSIASAVVGPNTTICYFMEEYLAYVAQLNAQHGFVTRKAARGSYPVVQATADIAWRALGARLPLDPIYLQEAQDAIAWVAAWTQGRTLNDYEYNVSVVAALPTVESRTAGLAASIIAAKEREAQKAQRAAAAPAPSLTPSSYFGTKGVRETFALTFIDARYIAASYPGAASPFLYRFVDAAGNQAAYFSERDLNLSAGVSYKLKATVKDQREYKGVKQTILTRITVLP